MRTLLLLPLAVLGACASTSPQDLQKMSTVDVCYTGMMEPEKKPMVEAELQRRKESCDQYSAQLKKMADEEARAGGQMPGQDAAKTVGAPTMGSGGGMGRY